MNIVGLSSTNNPYVQARWSSFSAYKHDYDVSLIEFGRISSVYAWKPVKIEVTYKRIILSDKPSQFQSIGHLLLLIHQLYKALSAVKPDVLVLNGYQQPATLAALLWSKFYRKPVILLSESKEDDAPRKWLMESVKKLLIRQYQSALVSGEKHREYLVKLGMPRDAIFLGYGVVGNDTYTPNKLAKLSHPVETNQPYFLAINRFITKKNIPAILEAYSEYRRHHILEAWDLIICGDGELRSQIEAQISALDLNSNVHLTGFLQPDELLPYFAHASCFIHASTQEQWGLVVNEAMASGLPVIISRCCGCFDELVIDGVTGFGFDANQPSELTKLMSKMSGKKVDLCQMKHAALNRIAQFGPSFFADGLNKSVSYATSQMTGCHEL